MVQDAAGRFEPPFTLVSFHAHPDDESMLTGGTLARAAAEGHRVVLVVATDGAAGLSDRPAGPGLAAGRLLELERAAACLGVARTVLLGYADSGADGSPDGFSSCAVGVAAERLAEVLRTEKADVLTIYDARGGYGHADHIQVHHVGVAAAQLAGTPLVLEATVDRTSLLRLARMFGWLPFLPHDFLPDRLRGAYTPRNALTHRVDVRRFADPKRAAMAAHSTQTSGGTGRLRSLGVYLLLPAPLFRRVLGHEWFVERGRRPGIPLLDDVFASLRSPQRRAEPLGAGR